MNSPIHAFLGAVRARLNRSLVLRVALGGLVGAAGAAIVWALAWRWFGYAAPRLGYAIAAAAALTAAAALAIFRRRDVRRSASIADRQFHLKDALVSFLDFHHRADHDAPVYQLQRAATEAAVADKRPAEIPHGIRPRAVWLAAGLVLAAACLALIPHSPAVTSRLEAEQATLERSEVIAAEIDKVVEQIIAAMSERERELLKPETLRAWAKDIIPTKDQRDLMKQIARFEQKVAAAITGLEARKDEEILKLAAAELDASQLADAKQLSKKLDAKDYEAAQKQLGEFKPGDAKSLKPEDLEKLRKQTAKLKEMSRRMANGARKRDFAKGDPKTAKDGAKEMDELLEDLEEAANDAHQKLEKQDPNDCDLDGMGEKLGKLGQRLGKLDAKEKARARMKALGKCAGEAQRMAAGQSQMLGLAQQLAQNGGLKPGSGHMDGKRNERDEFKDNQNLTQLEGKQGQGESKSSVESADSGTGISGRGSAERERAFRKQAESLVHRDDVPEELKQGIREYFQRVHQTPEPEK